MSFSKRNNQGFTILYAILIAGVLLSIGVSVASIAIREVALVANAEQSTNAFYIADSGMECALYLDFASREKVIADQSGVNPSPNMTNVYCGAHYNTNAQNQMPTPSYSTLGEYRVTSLTVYFDSLNGDDPPYDPNGRCALLTIQRSTTNGTTIIDSRGFTTCNTSNPKVVERGIRVNY